MLGEKASVLVAAGGAGWEVDVLQALALPGSGAVLVKRCVDLPDLLATAATGQARGAVVSASLEGLDVESVERLHRGGVGVVLVTPGEPPEGEVVPGADRVVPASAPDEAVAAVKAAAGRRRAGESGSSGAPTPGIQLPPGEGPGVVVDEDSEGSESGGHVVAVWGPTGAPGRTTVAVGVAAELALRGQDTLLVDADGYGGAVAQHLGVLDEVSGLLGGVRLANAGRLDASRLVSLARTVLPNLRVLTGLPRADRWVEVRAHAFDTLLETAREVGAFVVLDLGFGIEQAPLGLGGSAPQRNQMTLAGLDAADELVVVGAADPVGLTRLARGVVELHEQVPVASPHLVVNRMRPSVGWGEQEVETMLRQLSTASSTHFLPFDQAAADRALALGSPLTELGESALRSGLARLVDSLDAAPATGATAARGSTRQTRRFRRRRAGRAR